MNRIYKVKVLNEEVLIRAGTKGAAIRYAMASTCEAVVASQEDLVRLTAKGVGVQDIPKKGA